MTSFIQTMFVPNSPPQPYSQCPQPLPALHTNVLAESESCLHFVYPESPKCVYQSPLQRHIQNVFHSPPTTTTTPTTTTEDHTHPQHPPLPFVSHIPMRQEDRTHEALRGPRGLPWGWLPDDGGKSDLLTHSNSNARNRTHASFQPQKRAKGTNSWQLKQFAEATLGSGSLRKVVQLPEGEDRDEWLAVNGELSEHTTYVHNDKHSRLTRR